MPTLPPSLNNKLDLKIYRMLLRLFPTDFWKRYEYSLVQVFRDQLLENSSPRRRIILWVKTIRDISWNAVEEHGQRMIQTPFILSHNLLWALIFSVSIPLSRQISPRIIQFFQPSVGYPLGNLLLSADMEYIVQGLMLGLIQWLFFRNYIKGRFLWPVITLLGYYFGLKSSMILLN